MEADIPTWADNLRWVVVAIMLAVAFVGPRIFSGVIHKIKEQLPPPQSSPPLGSTQLAVVGAALADRESLQALTEAIHRTADLMEARLELENQASQEAKARRMIGDLLQELRDKERTTDRDKK